MSSVRGRDTRPELVLRKALHARGLRYRLHASDVIGRPDVVNRRRKIAIFLDGDFWHGNPAEWKRRGFSALEDQFPPSKRAIWSEKLRKNIERDRFVTASLEQDGWRVLRFWESDILGNADCVVDDIVAAWL